MRSFRRNVSYEIDLTTGDSLPREMGKYKGKKAVNPLSVGLCEQAVSLKRRGAEDPAWKLPRRRMKIRILSECYKYR